MGRTEDDTTAGSRLRLLYDHFREHPRTGPAERTSPSVRPGVPVNLAVVDHIDSCVREVVDDTRALNPDADPLPAELADVYDWYRQQTRHASETDRLRRDTVIYRQYLEHALAMGDVDVVRPHRCPACQTFSLMWPTDQCDPKTGRARCTKKTCRTKTGMTRTWTLARLAYEHVALEKTLRECATR